MSTFGLGQPDLAGVAIAVAAMRQELAEVREMAQALQERLDEMVQLLRGSVAAHPEAAEPHPTEDGQDDLGPAGDDATALVPVDGLTVVDERAGSVDRARRWGMGMLLVVLAVVIGVMVAGVAILLAVFGWKQMRPQIGGLAALTWLPETAVLRGVRMAAALM